MTEPASPAPRSRARRWLSWSGVAIALIALAFTGYSCFWPQDRSTYSAPELRLEENGVTYVANGPLYLVLQPDGSFLALDETDRVHANFLNGCVIRWVSPVSGSPTAATAAAGTGGTGSLSGFFQEDPRCGGATFNIDGTPRGQGLPMLRHPVRLAGKSVVVDIRQCIAPENGPGATPMPCTDFRR